MLSYLIVYVYTIIHSKFKHKDIHEHIHSPYIEEKRNGYLFGLPAQTCTTGKVVEPEPLTEAR